MNRTGEEKKGKKGKKAGESIESHQKGSMQ
jgi:hypothetical protein